MKKIFTLASAVVLTIVVLTGNCGSAFAGASMNEIWEEYTDTDGSACLIFSTAKGTLGQLDSDGNIVSAIPKLHFDVFTKEDTVEIQLNSSSQPDVNKITTTLPTILFMVLASNSDMSVQESMVAIYDEFSDRLIFTADDANKLKKLFETGDMSFIIYEMHSDLTAATGRVFCFDLGGVGGSAVFKVKYQDVFNESTDYTAMKGSIAANQITYIDGMSCNGRFNARKDGKMGVIDSQGNVLVDFVYDIVDYLSENTCCVYNGKVEMLGDIPTPKYEGDGKYAGKFGLIDYNGNFVSPMDWDYMEASGNGMWMVAKNGKFGIIDDKGNTVVPCEYDGSNKGSEQALVLYKYDNPSDYKSKKYYLFDINGNMLIEGAESIKGMSDGLCAVKKDGLFGYVDVTGAWVIQPDFTAVSSFCNGRAVAAKKGSSTCSIIDKTGAAIAELPCSSDYAPTIYENRVFVMNGNTGLYALYNSDGTQITDYEYTSTGIFKNGTCRVKNSKGQYAIIDKEGKILLPYSNLCKDYIAEGYYETQTGEYPDTKYGIIDAAGKTILDCVYDGVYYKDGYYVVNTGLTYSIYDEAFNKLF